MREGQITDHDMRYRGLVSLGRNGSVNEVVIARLTSRHDGVYEVKDRDGNLVSSTSLQVIGKCCEIFWSDYLYRSIKCSRTAKKKMLDTIAQQCSGCHSGVRP